MAKKQLVVGLTGGIGSGKSEVATRFAKLDAKVIDADRIAHQLLQPGTTQFQTTLERFGRDLLCRNGTIDRAQLRQIIFNNRREQKWLAQLLHPIIREIMAKQIAENDAPYSLLVIPLLIENWPHPLVDRVLVVDVDEKVQRARARRRDQASAEQINAIIARQASREQRLAHADDIINNSGDLTQLDEEVATLHRYYLAGARAE